jgi:hypothetical protein
VCEEEEEERAPLPAAYLGPGSTMAPARAGGRMRHCPPLPAAYLARMVGCHEGPNTALPCLRSCFSEALLCSTAMAILLPALLRAALR